MTVLPGMYSICSCLSIMFILDFSWTMRMVALQIAEATFGEST